jgi:hypothetical protein
MYVKESDRTTAWWLFNKKFHCKVNLHRARSIEEIQAHGTPTTGFPDLDRELERAMTPVMLTIVEMEDHYNNGNTLHITNRADTKLIYEYITNHLMAFKKLLEESENAHPSDETLDELIRLDRFAADVLIYARHQMTETRSYSGLARAFGGANSQRQRIMQQMRKNSRNNTGQPMPLVSDREVHGGAGRTYGRASLSERGRPIQERAAVETREPDALVDADGVIQLPEFNDSHLPKHISLERLFENQKSRGLDYR